MKKNKKHLEKVLYLPMALLFLSNSVTGQITKGNWLMGGNGSFSHEKTTFSNGEIVSTQIDLTPRIGYFVSDRFALGLLGNYRWVSSNSNNIKSSYSDYGIGPFIRYYFLSPENRTNVLIDGSGSYNGRGNSIISDIPGFISYSLLAGPVIFLNSSVGLELLLGYKGYKELKNETKSNGMNFSIGIQYHLERDN
jgi:hypothetical protein